MKLSLENLSQNLSWKGYRLPQYDIQAARDYTKAHPVWSYSISALATCSALSPLCLHSAC